MGVTSICLPMAQHEIKWPAATARHFRGQQPKYPLSTVAFRQRPPKKIANLPEGYLQKLQSGGTCTQAYPVRVISFDRGGVGLVHGGRLQLRLLLMEPASMPPTWR